LKWGYETSAFFNTKKGINMQKHPLQDIIEPVVTELGYELVRVMTTGSTSVTLQVMIDRIDDKNVTVDDCAKVSRALSEVLDEKDPISEDYNLEVSSPGLDRPLTKLGHFERFDGYEAKVETSIEVEGRKRFKGILNGIDKNNVLVDMDGQVYHIPFDDINKAKLVLTDELLAAQEQEF
jgi:ribosome maturation factor RimP